VASLLELEHAILTRLQELIPEARIDELPLDPAEIGIAVGATQIWVAFSRVQFEAPPATAAHLPVKAPAQACTWTFEIFLRCQNLRVKGHHQVYPIVDKILHGIGGWLPTDIHRTGGTISKPFYPVSAGFTSMAGGLWLYSLSFATTGVFNPNIRI
jgi:hypothetical protein